MLRVFHTCRNDRANVTRLPTIFIGTGLSVRSMGTEFQSRYHEELRNEADITKQVRQLEKKYRTITLVFSARDEQHNQAVALLGFLRKGGLHAKS
jgi:Protein of unknown function, DUF488